MNKIQELKWSHHKLTDNLGMTLEQSKEINEIITIAHNNAIDECKIFIENEVRNRFIKETTIGQNTINVFDEIMRNL
jgi:hypothetical protein